MKIRTGSTKCLHTQSRPLTGVNKKVLRFAKKLVNTMIKAEGVGLAAPQVGKNIEMFSMIDHKNQQIVVMINPRITKFYVESGTSIQEEGCLSCPGKTKEIERHNEIEIDYVGIDGEPHKVRCKGIDARIVQHELDHLDGILITDYE